MECEHIASGQENGDFMNGTEKCRVPEVKVNGMQESAT
jgi:hypothetical protein